MPWREGSRNPSVLICASVLVFWFTSPLPPNLLLIWAFCKEGLYCFFCSVLFCSILLLHRNVEVEKYIVLVYESMNRLSLLIIYLSFSLSLEAQDESGGKDLLSRTKRLHNFWSYLASQDSIMVVLCKGETFLIVPFVGWCSIIRFVLPRNAFFFKLCGSHVLAS
jgi:hypothetical protein